MILSTSAQEEICTYQDLLDFEFDRNQLISQEQIEQYDFNQLRLQLEKYFLLDYGPDFYGNTWLCNVLALHNKLRNLVKEFFQQQENTSEAITEHLELCLRVEMKIAQNQELLGAPIQLQSALDLTKYPYQNSEFENSHQQFIYITTCLLRFILEEDQQRMEKSYIINANNDENEIDKLCNSLISMIIQTLQDGTAGVDPIAFQNLLTQIQLIQARKKQQGLPLKVVQESSYQYNVGQELPLLDAYTQKCKQKALKLQTQITKQENFPESAAEESKSNLNQSKSYQQSSNDLLQQQNSEILKFQPQQDTNITQQKLSNFIGNTSSAKEAITVAESEPQSLQISPTTEFCEDNKQQRTVTETQSPDSQFQETAEPNPSLQSPDSQFQETAEPNPSLQQCVSQNQSNSLFQTQNNSVQNQPDNQQSNLFSQAQPVSLFQNQNMQGLIRLQAVRMTSSQPPASLSSTDAQIQISPSEMLSPEQFNISQDLITQSLQNQNNTQAINFSEAQIEQPGQILQPNIHQQQVEQFSHINQPNPQLIEQPVTQNINTSIQQQVPISNTAQTINQSNQLQFISNQNTLSTNFIINQPSSGSFQNLTQSTSSSQQQQGGLSQNPPQAGLFQNPPQAGLFQNPPQAGLFQNAPQAGLLQNPPQTSLFPNSPQTSLSQNAPQAGLSQNPPQTSLFQNAPQAGLLQNPPQASLFQNAPQAGLLQNPLQASLFQNPLQAGLFQNLPQPGLLQNPLQAGLFQNAPQTGLFQNAPQAGLLQNAPQAGLSQNAPQAGLFQNAPQAGLLQNPPQAGLFQNPPQAGLFQNPPQAGLFQNAPQVGLLQNAPQAVLLQNAPQAGLLQNAPQASLFQNAPQAGLLQNPPQAGLFQNPPQAGLFQNPPQTSLFQNATQLNQSSLYIPTQQPPVALPANQHSIFAQQNIFQNPILSVQGGQQVQTGSQPHQAIQTNLQTSIFSNPTQSISSGTQLRGGLFDGSAPPQAGALRSSAQTALFQNNTQQVQDSQQQLHRGLFANSEQILQRSINQERENILSSLLNSVNFNPTNQNGINIGLSPSDEAIYTDSTGQGGLRNPLLPSYLPPQIVQNQTLFNNRMQANNQNSDSREQTHLRCRLGESNGNQQKSILKRIFEQAHVLIKNIASLNREGNYIQQITKCLFELEIFYTILPSLRARDSLINVIPVEIQDDFNQLIKEIQNFLPNLKTLLVNTTTESVHGEQTDQESELIVQLMQKFFLICYELNNKKLDEELQKIYLQIIDHLLTPAIFIKLSSSQLTYLQLSLSRFIKTQIMTSLFKNSELARGWFQQALFKKQIPSLLQYPEIFQKQHVSNGLLKIIQIFTLNVFNLEQLDDCVFEFYSNSSNIPELYTQFFEKLALQPNSEQKFLPFQRALALCIPHIARQLRPEAAESQINLSGDKFQYYVGLFSNISLTAGKQYIKNFDFLIQQQEQQQDQQNESVVPILSKIYGKSYQLAYEKMEKAKHQLLKGAIPAPLCNNLIVFIRSIYSQHQGNKSQKQEIQNSQETSIKKKSPPDNCAERRLNDYKRMKSITFNLFLTVPKGIKPFFPRELQEIAEYQEQAGANQENTFSLVSLLEVLMQYLQTNQYVITTEPISHQLFEILANENTSGNQLLLQLIKCIKSGKQAGALIAQSVIRELLNVLHQLFGIRYHDQAIQKVLPQLQNLCLLEIDCLRSVLSNREIWEQDNILNNQYLNNNFAQQQDNQEEKCIDTPVQMQYFTNGVKLVLPKINSLEIAENYKIQNALAETLITTIIKSAQQQNNDRDIQISFRQFQFAFSMLFSSLRKQSQQNKNLQNTQESNLDNFGDRDSQLQQAKLNDQKSQLEQPDQSNLDELQNLDLILRKFLDLEVLNALSSNFKVTQKLKEKFSNKFQTAEKFTSINIESINLMLHILLLQYFSNNNSQENQPEQKIIFEIFEQMWQLALNDCEEGRNNCSKIISSFLLAQLNGQFLILEFLSMAYSCPQVISLIPLPRSGILLNLNIGREIKLAFQRRVNLLAQSDISLQNLQELLENSFLQNKNLPLEHRSKDAKYQQQRNSYIDKMLSLLFFVKKTRLSVSKQVENNKIELDSRQAKKILKVDYILSFMERLILSIGEQETSFQAQNVLRLATINILIQRIKQKILKFNFLFELTEEKLQNNLLSLLRLFIKQQEKITGAGAQINKIGFLFDCLGLLAQTLSCKQSSNQSQDAQQIYRELFTQHFINGSLEQNFSLSILKNVRTLLIDYISLSLEKEWHLRNTEIHLKNAHYKSRKLRLQLTQFEEKMRKKAFIDNQNLYVQVLKQLETTGNYATSFITCKQESMPQEVRAILDILIDHGLKMSELQMQKLKSNSTVKIPLLDATYAAECLLTVMEIYPVLTPYILEREVQLKNEARHGPFIYELFFGLEHRFLLTKLLEEDELTIKSKLKLTNFGFNQLGDGSFVPQAKLCMDLLQQFALQQLQNSQAKDDKLQQSSYQQEFLQEIVESLYQKNFPMSIREYRETLFLKFKGQMRNNQETSSIDDSKVSDQYQKAASRLSQVIIKYYQTLLVKDDSMQLDNQEQAAILKGDISEKDLQSWQSHFYNNFEQELCQVSTEQQPQQTKVTPSQKQTPLTDLQKQIFNVQIQDQDQLADIQSITQNDQQVPWKCLLEYSDQYQGIKQARVLQQRRNSQLGPIPVSHRVPEFGQPFIGQNSLQRPGFNTNSVYQAPFQTLLYGTGYNDELEQNYQDDALETDQIELTNQEDSIFASSSEQIAVETKKIQSLENNTEEFIQLLRQHKKKYTLLPQSDLSQQFYSKFLESFLLQNQTVPSFQENQSLIENSTQEFTRQEQQLDSQGRISAINTVQQLTESDKKKIQVQEILEQKLMKCVENARHANIHGNAWQHSFCQLEFTQSEIQKLKETIGQLSQEDRSDVLARIPMLLIKEFGDSSWTDQASYARQNLFKYVQPHRYTLASTRLATFARQQQEEYQIHIKIVQENDKRQVVPQQDLPKNIVTQEFCFSYRMPYLSDEALLSLFLNTINNSLQSGTFNALVVATLNAYNCYRLMDTLGFILMLEEEDWKLLSDSKDQLQQLLVGTFKTEDLKNIHILIRNSFEHNFFPLRELIQNQGNYIFQHGLFFKGKALQLLDSSFRHTIQGICSQPLKLVQSARDRLKINNSEDGAKIFLSLIFDLFKDQRTYYIAQDQNQSIFRFMLSSCCTIYLSPEDKVIRGKNVPKDLKTGLQERKVQLPFQDFVDLLAENAPSALDQNKLNLIKVLYSENGIWFKEFVRIACSDGQQLAKNMLLSVIFADTCIIKQFDQQILSPLLQKIAEQSKILCSEQEEYLSTIKALYENTSDINEHEIAQNFQMNEKIQKLYKELIDETKNFYLYSEFLHTLILYLVQCAYSANETNKNIDEQVSQLQNSQDIAEIKSMIKYLRNLENDTQKIILQDIRHQIFFSLETKERVNQFALFTQYFTRAINYFQQIFSSKNDDQESMHLPSSVSTLISQGVVSALHYNSVYLGGAAGLKNDEFSESAQGFVYTTEQSFQNKEKTQAAKVNQLEIDCGYAQLLSILNPKTVRIILGQDNLASQFFQEEFTRVCTDNLLKVDSNNTKALNQIIDSKLTLIRSIISAEHGFRLQSHIEIDRAKPWSSTLRNLLEKHDPQALRNQVIKIKFQGELGSDAGGLTRDWLSIVSAEIFNPSYGLFRYCANKRSLYISMTSYIVPNHLVHFRYLGRFIAKALLESEWTFEVSFSRALLKQLLGKPLFIQDYMDIDNEETRQLLKLLELEDLSALGLYMEDDFFILSENLTNELVEDGSQKLVTKQNATNYVKLRIKRKLNDNVKQQIKALRNGMEDLIPRHLLRLLTENELGLQLEGLSVIDDKEFAKFLELEDYNRSDTVITNLIQVFHDWDQVMRANFLFFATGSFKLPKEGFQQYPIQVTKKNGSSEQLPVAHTCFRMIELPPYESKEKLKTKLELAITYGSQSFQIM